VTTGMDETLIERLGIRSGSLEARPLDKSWRPVYRSTGRL
jgi:hypothetical protein